jgi:two-component system, response regulator YesN
LLIIDSIKELMELYSEITKLTIICLNSLHRKLPLFVIGLDLVLLTEFAEYEDVIDFLEADDTQLIHTVVNSFHTFYTKRNFVYNIFLLSLGKEKLELIAGPMLEFAPTSKSLLKRNECIDLPIYKKNAFLDFLNSIPFITNESIHHRGMLFVILCQKQLIDMSLPVQRIYQHEDAYNDLLIIENEDDISSRYNTKNFDVIYRFLSTMLNHIIRGNVNGVTELIGDYGYLFWGIKSLGNNYRTLKNRCIVTCTIACHSAVQANAPFEKMFRLLNKSISIIEHSTKAYDIILTMTKTIVNYAQSVSVLSTDNYSIHTKRAMQYIRNHFTEKITLIQLAEYIHINHIYLSGLINKETNLSLSSHINLMRIEESKYLLLHTTKSIHEIAITVGYNYQNHYNNIFKKLVGITPLEYRHNSLL